MERNLRKKEKQQMPKKLGKESREKGSWKSEIIFERLPIYSLAERTELQPKGFKLN
jgi:hypothetical protein